LIGRLAAPFGGEISSSVANGKDIDANAIFNRDPIIAAVIDILINFSLVVNIYNIQYI
tara:strand:+ start:8816 stop:8989 length:174 start_codon:yes stop_codon:yes gene_type:complete